MDYPEHEKFSHQGITKALLAGLEMALMGDEKNPNYGWYNGLLFAVDGLSAADAARSLGPDRSTVASHVDHVRVCLTYVRHALAGEPYQADWGNSWHSQTVSHPSEAEWAEIRESLKREYAALIAFIEGKPFWREQGLSAAIHNVAHTAYHAGAVRQILKASVEA